MPRRSKKSPDRRAFVCRTCGSESVPPQPWCQQAARFKVSLGRCRLPQGHSSTNAGTRRCAARGSVAFRDDLGDGYDQRPLGGLRRESRPGGRWQWRSRDLFSHFRRRWISEDRGTTLPPTPLPTSGIWVAINRTQLLVRGLHPRSHRRHRSCQRDARMRLLIRSVWSRPASIVDRCNRRVGQRLHLQLATG